MFRSANMFGGAMAGRRFRTMARLADVGAVANRVSLFKAGAFNMRQSIDAVAADAVIDEAPVVVTTEFISDHTVLVETVQPSMVNMPSPFMVAHAHKPFVKVVVAHEGEAGFTQPEVEIQPHHHAMITEAAIDKHGSRRQRRPANAGIHFVMTPENPCRPPYVVRLPEPAHTRVQNPPAIMEWDVAPSVIRLPVKAVFRLYPLPHVVIRTPIRIDGQGCIRAPIHDAFDIYPSAKRRQLIVKILKVDFRLAGWGGHHGGGRRIGHS